MRFPTLSGKLRRVNSFSRLQPHYLVAVLAGLLLTAAFPKFDVAGLAWVAPGFLLFTALGQDGTTSFRLGYVAGLAHYLASLYWLLFIPFPAGAVAGWLALSMYSALYPAAWLWLCWKICPRVPAGLAQSWWSAAGQFLTTTWWPRARWAMLCAALWVALEMIRARFLSGFPWNPLGVSQFRILPVTQIASITGVYGVSFLIVWFSVSLTLALARLAHQPGLGWACVAELRLALIGLLVVAAFGVNRVLERNAASRELNVALVQPSIPQTLIWDHSQDAARFDKIMQLSKLALANKPDLLIWPESAMPSFTEENFRAITNLVAEHKVWMIFGADDAEPRQGETGPNDNDFFNAAFLFDREGKFLTTYRKQRLVVFGEYLPLARWLPFLRKIIPVPGDFTPGSKRVTFELSEPRVKTSVLICFEDVFPDLAREGAGEDIDFLLNITNDGWFGNSAAQWQQAANSVFRALENGLPLVRCTNNGLTCWIDARGGVREILGTKGGDIYAPGFLTAKIPLLAAGQKREPTFYHRHGDWFGWGCVLVSVVACASGLRQRRST